MSQYVSAVLSHPVRGTCYNSPKKCLQQDTCLPNLGFAKSGMVLPYTFERSWKEFDYKAAHMQGVSSERRQEGILCEQKLYEEDLTAGRSRQTAGAHHLI